MFDNDHLYRRQHTFDLGANPGTNFKVFQEGQIVATKIASGLVKGHWVKTKIVGINLRDGTLDLEVINNEKWNLKKHALRVQFADVDQDISKALNDEHALLVHRVDQLSKLVRELRRSKTHSRQMSEELQLKLRERDRTIEILENQLEEQMEKVNILERRIFGEEETQKKPQEKNSNLSKPRKIKTHSWAPGNLELEFNSVSDGKDNAWMYSDEAEFSKPANFDGEETLEVLQLRKENAFLRSIAQNTPKDKIKKENATLQNDLARANQEIKLLKLTSQELRIKLKVQDYETEGSKFLISKLQNEVREWRRRQRESERIKQPGTTGYLGGSTSNLAMSSSSNSLMKARRPQRLGPSAPSSMASDEASHLLSGRFSSGSHPARYPAISRAGLHSSTHTRLGQRRVSVGRSPVRVKSNNPVWSPGNSITSSGNWTRGFARSRDPSRYDSDVERNSVLSQDSLTNTISELRVSLPDIHDSSVLKDHGSGELFKFRSPASASSLKSDSLASQSPSRKLRPYIRRLFNAANGVKPSDTAFNDGVSEKFVLDRKNSATNLEDSRIDGKVDIVDHPDFCKGRVRSASATRSLPRTSISSENRKISSNPRKRNSITRSFRIKKRQDNSKVKEIPAQSRPRKGSHSEKSSTATKSLSLQKKGSVSGSQGGKHIKL